MGAVARTREWDVGLVLSWGDGKATVQDGSSPAVLVLLRHNIQPWDDGKAIVQDGSSPTVMVGLRLPSRSS